MSAVVGADIDLRKNPSLNLARESVQDCHGLALLERVEPVEVKDGFQRAMVNR
jgi:hypothetical protein